MRQAVLNALRPLGKRHLLVSLFYMRVLLISHRFCPSEVDGGVPTAAPLCQDQVRHLQRTK
jgi:hypothetical protein